MGSWAGQYVNPNALFMQVRAQRFHGSQKPQK